MKEKRKKRTISKNDYLKFPLISVTKLQIKKTQRVKSRINDKKVTNIEVFIFTYRKLEMKEIPKAAKSNFSSEITKLRNLVWNINGVARRNYRPNVYVTKISFIFKLWNASQIFRPSLSWGHSDLYCIVMISGYVLRSYHQSYLSNVKDE